MTDAEPEALNPNHPDWRQGYSDGFHGRPHAQTASANYHDGWLTGDAERDMPPPDSPVWQEWGASA